DKNSHRHRHRHCDHLHLIPSPRPSPRPPPYAVTSTNLLEGKQKRASAERDSTYAPFVPQVCCQALNGTVSVETAPPEVHCSSDTISR
nr:hypothetical protein [Tanacetum cinerariifolium]